MQRLLVATCVLLITSDCLAQSDSARATHGVPSGVFLLPGYAHQPIASIDTLAGSISKEGGLSIKYVSGTEAGNFATSSARNAVWSRELNQGIRQLWITLDEDDTLYVSFVYERPARRRGFEINFEANFYGKVNSEEEVASFLMMVLGYAWEIAPATE